MKKIFNKIMLFLILSASLMGCSGNVPITDEEIITESATDLEQTDEQTDEQTETLGSLRHGLAGCNEDDDTKEILLPVFEPVDEDTTDGDKEIKEPGEVNEPEMQEMYLGVFSGSVEYAEDGKLLLLGNDSKLVDISAPEVIKESDNDETVFNFNDLWRYELVTCADGYTVIGNLYNKQEAKTDLTIVRYNEELQIQQVVNANELLGVEDEIFAYELFDNGRQLLYSTIDGLFLYNTESSETETLCENDIIVWDCDVPRGSDEAFFTGEQNKGNVTFDRTFGIIDLDKKSVETDEHDYLWGNVWCFENHVLMDEADVYGKEKAKEVFCYRPSEGIQSYPLSNEQEDGYIFPSREGAYYATGTRLQDEGYAVRIYSSEDGRLIREIPMRYDEYGADFRISDILICEDTAKIILLVRGWKNQDDGEWLILIDL